MPAIFQLPVSRLMAARVLRHIGAATNQASSDSAVARLQSCASSGASTPAASSPVADRA